MLSWEEREGNCQPEKKNNVYRGKAVNYILYWMLIKYIVYITLGFKTIQVKYTLEFVFRTL